MATAGGWNFLMEYFQIPLDLSRSKPQQPHNQGVIWPKGLTLLTVIALKNKLAPQWNNLDKWDITSLEKGFYEFSFSFHDEVKRVRESPSWNLAPEVEENLEEVGDVPEDNLAHTFTLVRAKKKKKKLNLSSTNPVISSFKFLHMGTTNPSFLEVIKSIWKTSFYDCPMFVLIEKLKILKKNLKIWNHNTYGNVHSIVKLTKVALNQVHVTNYFKKLLFKSNHTNLDLDLIKFCITWMIIDDINTIITNSPFNLEIKNEFLVLIKMVLIGLMALEPLSSSIIGM
ncbi:hypothetical protein KIW84_074786 [Lathyrus oleraceus]|uniref:Uncharacterized protein n=1 Tax=Pisum sativum TaxID=3888 RepID=A0A9D5A0C5_PEA|nr:hypothetical protein KIW84_074786 [Pisum sativum]